MSQWVSVRDELPDRDQLGDEIFDRGFLVIDEDGCYWVAEYKPMEGWFYAWTPNDNMPLFVVQWMVLPGRNS